MSMSKRRSMGEIIFKAIVGTEDEAYRVATAIEKMIDTEANSTDQEQAKKELTNALLRRGTINIHDLDSHNHHYMGSHSHYVDSKDNLEQSILDIMANYGVPLIDFKETLEKVIQHVTDDSKCYLSNCHWNTTENHGYFERTYGVRPFGPCSIDASGLIAKDENGNIIPHKKLVIGHLGSQEIIIDVLDQKD